MKRVVLSATLVSALAVAACTKKPPEVIPPQPTGVATPTPTPAPTPTAPTGPVKGSYQDFLASVNGQDIIYFDTDKYNIDDADMAALRAQAQWLLRYPNVRATIEGHCDERGTRDYNLALGERRANAAKNYLVGLGVSEDRLTTISYGKERPVALGSNEAAWAKNRRAATITIN